MIKIGFTKEAEKQAQKTKSAEPKKKGMLERLKKHSDILKDD